MKALVLEKRDGLAAVLREDGVYITTAQPCEVGETIELSEKVVAFPRRKNRWLRSAVAAVLALVIFTGSYSYLATTAYAYVSLDVEEASVEVSVNRLGRVIGVNAINEDSAALAQELNTEMRGKRVEDAMDSAMERFHEEGMFDDPNIFVIAGVTSGSEKQRKELTATVERAAHEAGAKDGEIKTFDVSHDERREAREQEMSGGRFAFAQRGGGRTDEKLPDENRATIAPESPAQETESFLPPDTPQESEPNPDDTQPADVSRPTQSEISPEPGLPEMPVAPMQPELPNEPQQPDVGTDVALPEPSVDSEQHYPQEESAAPPTELVPSVESRDSTAERPDMQGELPGGEPQNDSADANSGQDSLFHTDLSLSPFMITNPFVCDNDRTESRNHFEN